MEKSDSKLKMILMGRKKYTAELLEWTVRMGIQVVAVCTETKGEYSATEITARRLGIPVIEMEEVEQLVINDPDAVDLVVSYLYWRKIRKPLIEIPRYGCINFHPAILPDWRGTAGYNIAILNKLSSWGATAHYVDETIDTGKHIQMDLHKSVILDVLEAGRLKSIPQNHSEGEYISRQKMEEMKRTDLEKDDLDLKIKAFWFPPYDGAYIEIKGKKYTLINNEILKSISGGVDDDSCFSGQGRYAVRTKYMLWFGGAA